MAAQPPSSPADLDTTWQAEPPRAELGDAAAPRRGVSIALVLIVALVVVVTALLGAFAAVVYGHEKARHAEQLRAKARSVAEQQATALSLPLWNLNLRQQLAIMQSALRDRDVHAVVTETPRDTVVQSRDPHGSAPAAAAADIVEQRDIEYRGERLGRVHVHVTPKWRDQELVERRDAMLAVILALDGALVIALFVLLDTLMLAPVRELQRDAAAVQAGRGIVRGGRRARFIGELRWLERSIAGMTAMLDARFRALRDSEQRLKLAARALHIGVWDWDVVNDVLVWDAQMHRLYGAGRDEFAGNYEAWTGRLLPAQRDDIDAAIRAALRGERDFAAEFEIRRADGSVRVLRGEASTIRDDAGRAVRMVGVNFDVTDRRRDEAEIRALNADLERRVRERTMQFEAANAELALSRDAAESATRIKGEFLANMSHEIRTPMNAVIGMLDLALRGEAATPKQQAYLTKAKAAAGSLLGVINDILDFSKIEAGKLEIEAREFALQEVLDRVTAVIGLRAREKRLELLIDTAPGVPQRLVGDSLRLEQVLINLCSNAVKFTERGEVVLATALAPDQPPGGARLRFAVRDTGVGIAQAQLPNLFRPFSQLDASTTRRYGGTGLGLAICAKLVALMGGEIGVTSRAGAGSEFHFTAAFGRGGEAAPPVPAAPCRARVLVVDDSASARDIFESLLGALGHGVVAVADAGEALVELERAAAAAQPFDVVLLDWRMADVDGFDAAERVRRLALPGGAPRMIMVSTWGDDAVCRRALAVGLDGCLAKPVSAAALAEAIAGALRWRPAAAACSQAQAAAPVPPALRGRRVLLVEDNEFNRIVASELLGEVAGMHVVCAGNGHEALLALGGGERFDLVLMDVQMPVMDGYEATQLLRRDPAHDKLPVIAMTAHAMAGARERCLAAGMDDYLSKPIDPAALFAMLARWSDGERAPHCCPAATAHSDHVSFELGLQRCLGRRELYARVLERALAEQPDAGEAARAAFDEGDLVRLAAVAHSMVTTAGAVGATALVDAARSLQVAADRAEIAALPGLLREFERLHALALEELRGFLALER